MSDQVVPEHKVTLKQKLKFVKYFQVADSFSVKLTRRVRNPLYKGVQVQGGSLPLSNASVELPWREVYFSVVIDGFWQDYTKCHRYVSEKFKSYAPKYIYVFTDRSVLLTQRIHKVKDRFVYTANVSSKGFETYYPHMFVYMPLDALELLTDHPKKLLPESEQDGLDKVINLFQAVKSFELKSRPHWLRVAEQL